MILELGLGLKQKNHMKYCQGHSSLRKYPEPFGTDPKTCNNILNKCIGTDNKSFNVLKFSEPFL